MNLLNITYLDWDSKFFSLNIYKLNEFNLSDKKFSKNLEDFVKLKNADLIYLESDFLIEDFLYDSKSLQASLVDIKTTFLKNDISEQTHTKLIKRSKEIDITVFMDEIIHLSQQSAEYSRFKLDIRFAINDYKKLYKEWILNSLNNKIADEVLFYQTEKNIAGLLTLGTKNERGDIGILAVDEQFRGMGIAKQMMLEAENWFFKNNLCQVQVVTQGGNLPAIALYKSCGYKLEKKNYFYHIWKIK